MNEPARVAIESAMSLHIQMTVNALPLATGTAFAVECNGTPHLITNRHNLSGRNTATNQPMSVTGATPGAVTIMHNAADTLGHWTPVTEPVVDGDGNPLWLEHPDLGSKVDVVALPLRSLDGVRLYPYDLTPPERRVAAGVSDGVSIIGFPFGVTGGGSLGIWTRGFVASEPEMDFHDLPLFLVDARTRQGQSGSPVIFYSSGGAVTMADGGLVVSPGKTREFLGVYSGRINAESDLGLVWKPAAVRRIVEAGVRPPAP